MLSFWETIGVIILIVAFIFVMSKTVKTLINFYRKDKE